MRWGERKGGFQMERKEVTSKENGKVHRTKQDVAKNNQFCWREIRLAENNN